jgi:hypothetical protein
MKHSLIAIPLSILLLGAGCNLREATNISEVPSPSQSAGKETMTIPEADATVMFPDTYSLTKNTEPTRRGSFVSYDFKRPENSSSPYFYEIDFFSQKSIADFEKTCEFTLCFEGDYPDTDRYAGQKIAFAKGQDYQDFTLRKIGNRNWFFSTFPCTGDSCWLREYTTFLGDTKVDVLIFMLDISEQSEADKLFEEFAIE